MKRTFLLLELVTEKVTTANISALIRINPAHKPCMRYSSAQCVTFHYSASVYAQYTVVLLELGTANREKKKEKTAQQRQ